jgi:putative FmdB family regulatory protein
MPIYEYECNQCLCHFDKRQQFHDEAVAACPKCQGISKRVMVPAPVIFKGSGFYVTDYRPKGSDGGQIKSEGSSPKSEGKSAKTEGSSAKPEAISTKAKG